MFETWIDFDCDMLDYCLFEKKGKNETSSKYILQQWEA
jgi:hypothetical protein